MTEHTILRDSGAGDPSRRAEQTAGDLPQRLPDEPPERATARGTVYGILALAFDRPGADFERALEDGIFTTRLPAAAVRIDDDLFTRADAVASSVPSLETAHDEWANLFGVEHGLAVSPYELSYLPGPLLTNIRRLADITGFYEAFDLRVRDGAEDRRDHIGFQNEFLAQLCFREATLRQHGDKQGVDVVVGARWAFLEDHLGRWYWWFVDEVAAEEADFYSDVAELLAAIVETDIDKTGLEPTYVPDDPSVLEWSEDVFAQSGRGCGGCGIG